MSDYAPRICLYMLAELDTDDAKVLWVRLGVTRAEADALIKAHLPHRLYMHLGIF